MNKERSRLGSASANERLITCRCSGIRRPSASARGPHIGARSGVEMTHTAALAPGRSTRRNSARQTELANHGIEAFVLEWQSLAICCNWMEVRVVQTLARAFKHGRRFSAPGLGVLGNQTMRTATGRAASWHPAVDAWHPWKHNLLRFQALAMPLCEAGPT